MSRLDSPAAVRKLAVLDVLPTSVCWDLADADFALGFWPWVLLAQDAPLPERVLTQAADEVVRSALTGWGTPPQVFPEALREAYSAALREHGHAHAICEEYRAAATLDREHDQADRQAGKKISCPLMALWSARGPLGTWYRAQGGPLEIWRSWADDVQGRAMDGGHFFPES